MITQHVLNFFSELTINNNKDWFNANKLQYQKVKLTLEKFAEKLINATTLIDNTINDLKPKHCMFRIYRDTRFSHDKTPYKTNSGIFLVKGGKKSGNAGYYVHIEPGNSFIGGGIHMPPSNILKAIRTEIYNYPEDIIEIISTDLFKSKFGEISGEKLSNPPRGFDKSFEQIELLKYKSFTIGHIVDEQFLLQENAIEMIIDSFKAMKPFIDFLNRAIKENIV